MLDNSATMKYDLLMCGDINISNSIKSFERGCKECYYPAHTLGTFRPSASAMVLGVFHCGRVDTQLYAVQQKPAPFRFNPLQLPILIETANVKHRGNNASKESDVKQLDWIANGNSRGLA
jgi:hypothetical protein